jgi:hypothetical protein
MTGYTYERLQIWMIAANILDSSYDEQKRSVTIREPQRGHPRFRRASAMESTALQRTQAVMDSSATMPTAANKRTS